MSTATMTSTFDLITPLPPTFMRLIEIGRAVERHSEGVDELLRGLAYDEWINCSLPTPYFAQAKRIPFDDLVCLILGLVTAEARLHWSGGSAASVIRLFRILEVRHAGRADQLGDWILQHTDNPYLPCGWQNEGQRTMEMYRRIPTWWEARRKAHEQECDRKYEEALRRWEHDKRKDRRDYGCRRRLRQSGRP
jgi:hypothetical protein